MSRPWTIFSSKEREPPVSRSETSMFLPRNLTGFSLMDGILSDAEGEGNTSKLPKIKHNDPKIFQKLMKIVYQLASVMN